jgi:carboxyl-terminal processing protease
VFRKNIVLALLILSSLFASSNSLSNNNTDTVLMSPTDVHLKATSLITNFLQRYHYRKFDLDDAFSDKIHSHFIESLDSGKNYFLASDIQNFEQYRYLLDDFLLNADLRAPYSFFALYQQRVSERVNYALSLLETDFDFSKDEVFLINREEASWPNSQLEQNDIWRKRVKNDVLSLHLAGKTADEIKTTLKKRYEGINKRSHQLNSNDVYQLFINAFATSIDPHTSYLSPRSYDNFEIRMSLSLEGIGAMLRLDGEYTLVSRVIPGGPADLSGLLKSKDRIIGIAQVDEENFVDIVGWRLDEVVDLIRGKKGTVVRLQLLRGEQGDAAVPEEISLTRNKIKLEEQAAQKTVLEINHETDSSKIGVITIPTFYMDFAAYQKGEKNYRSTTRDVDQLLNELKDEDIDTLILDLRSNGGGSLIEATNLAGLFIDHGPVVQVQDSSGNLEIHKDLKKGVSYDGPLVVLVDRFSASASEIVASALQDYGRAVVVGEATYGKGSVQQLINLNRFSRSKKAKLGQLKATIAQYFRVDGGSTQHKGVLPDINYVKGIKVSERGERSLKNALPWSQITPASYLGQVIARSVIDQLDKQHLTRVADNQRYQTMVKLFELNETLTDRKTVSLNETTRKKRFDELESKRKEFETALGIKDSQDEESFDEDNKIDPENDVLLLEAAEIAHDLKIFWNRKSQAIQPLKQTAAN